MELAYNCVQWRNFSDVEPSDFVIRTLINGNVAINKYFNAFPCGIV